VTKAKPGSSKNICPVRRRVLKSGQLTHRDPGRFGRAQGRIAALENVDFGPFVWKNAGLAGFPFRQLNISIHACVNGVALFKSATPAVRWC
jgi:hypothetical protein